MLKVLRREHGFIAFAQADQPRYADHLFDASGSPIRGEVSTAIDDYFALVLPDVTQWPEIRRLAEIHNIGLSEIVYVLFPIQDWNRIAASIRAEAQRQSLSGQITETIIQFNAGIPSGVSVENLTVVPLNGQNDLRLDPSLK